MSDGDWFAPRRFGYGAGRPIAWQGWLLVGVYSLALIAAGAALAPRHPLLFVALAIVTTIPLAVVSVQHTRGGWKWRWGAEK